MYANSISDLIDDRPLYVVFPTTTVHEACRIMSACNIGALPVVQADRLVGILSERDVIRRCVTGRRDAEATQVAEIMTPDPVTLDVADTTADAIACMMEGRFRHLPVRDGHTLVGMISMRDIPAENRLMVERFRDYPGIQAVYG